MVQPESLRSDQYLPWSRGRGVDVWAMLCASIAGDLATIKDLAARDPQLVECEYEYFTPIRFAVRENHRAVVEFLLENGAGAAYEAGDSLLSISRDRGYTELAAFLESKLKEGYRVVPEAAAVAAAIKARDMAQVRALLEKQPELIHAADERGNQPLHWAVMTRQIGLIDYLLQRGADINAARPDGLRPIHLTNGDYHYRGWRDVPSTALQRHEILIGSLLARGAAYDISTATKLGDLDRVRELLDENPALVNQVPAYSYYTGVRGLDPNRRNWLGITLLHRCAAKGDIAMAAVCLDFGAEIDAIETEWSSTPLGWAAREGKKEMVEWLLKNGADANLPEDEPWARPVDWAKRRGQQEIIELLQ